MKGNKIKVTFRDTEFGQFWAERRTMFHAHDGKLYRCVWLDCEWKGIPHSFLVLDQEAEGRLSEKESDDVAFFAAEQDGVWWILEEIFGEGAEVEYEGDEEMKEDNKKTVSVDVPSGTDRVMLNLNNKAGDGKTTLRSMLMAIEADKPVAVVVRDESKFPDGRVAQFAWRVAFPPYDKDSLSYRKDRVGTLANSTLCDAGALLDERKVDVGVSTDALGRYAITLSVKANG